MKNDALDLTTRRPAREAGGGAGRAFALTVLHHPDASRVGEVAFLDPSGKGARVSRLEPELSPPGAKRRAPLGDPFLSRRPIRIVDRDGMLHVQADPTGSPVTIAGFPDGAIPHSAAQGGVVMTLGDRVVLLLHTRSLRPGRSPDDLGLVGESEAIGELRADILRVASLEVAVLLRGESGTGKELVARAIHTRSARAGGPCVAVNVAALPPQTAVSELFGHVRGAFTGATADREGFFAAAHGGTLFLDEIGETSPEVQGMLLRALESLELHPLGATRPRRVDVRLVTATDADLERAVASGSFRQALFHRLSGYQILIPPLRSRRDDVGRLLIHFLREELGRVGEAERLEQPASCETPWFPASLAARLATYGWPGNVRQLRNVARQIAVSSRGAAQARVTPTLAALLDEPAAKQAASGPKRPRRDPSAITGDELRAALRAHGFRVGPAAESLGLSRSKLYDLLGSLPGLRKGSDLSSGEIERARAEHGGDLRAVAAALEVSPRALKLRLRQLGLA